MARAELRAMVPALRRSPLGVGVLAETLDAIEECRAEDFDPLVAGAPDRAVEAYRVAAAATCGGEFELPPIVFDRAGDRCFARWSTGWAGGTFRLRLVNGHWLFDTISSWIT